MRAPIEINNNVYLNATGSHRRRISGQLVYDENIVMELEVANEEQINGGDGIDINSVVETWNSVDTLIPNMTEQVVFDKTKHVVTSGENIFLPLTGLTPNPTGIGSYNYADTQSFIDALHNKAVLVPVVETNPLFPTITTTKWFLKGSIRLPYTKLKPTSDSSARILNDFFTNVQSTQVDQFIISSSSATGETPHSLATMDIPNSFKTENLNLICDNLDTNKVSIGVKYLQHDQADFDGSTTPVTTTYSITSISGALDAGKPWAESTCVYANSGGTGVKLNSKPKVEILEMFIYGDSMDDKRKLPICNGE